MNKENMQFYAQLLDTMPRDFKSHEACRLQKDFDLLKQIQKAVGRCETNLRQNIGKCIGKWKQRNKYKYSEASALLGMSPSQLSLWLNSPQEKRASIETALNAMSRAGVMGKY